MSHEPLCPGWIYATLLPTGVVKLGKSVSRVSRPYAARSFFAEPVEIVRLWRVQHKDRAELIAHAAARHWRLRRDRELFGGNALTNLETIDAVDAALKELLLYDSEEANAANCDLINPSTHSYFKEFRDEVSVVVPFVAPAPVRKIGRSHLWTAEKRQAARDKTLAHRRANLGKELEWLSS